MESLREVEQVEASAMAELVPEIVLFLESSAKDNTNVEQCFVELATELKVSIAYSPQTVVFTEAVNMSLFIM